ncbi:MAG: hypothetical protein V7K69_10735 [Nostoc sp.]|uniref:hypothetical protein n=1 Tax=Nostoc sp. TaxID=1180 RepID=UPI002FFB75A5
MNKPNYATKCNIAESFVIVSHEMLGIACFFAEVGFTRNYVLVDFPTHLFSQILTFP